MLCSGFLFGTTFITATNVAEAWLDDSNSTTVYAMIDQLMMDFIFTEPVQLRICVCFFISRISHRWGGA